MAAGDVVDLRAPLTDADTLFSPEAEHAVLGCVMYEPGCIELLDDLRPEHFREPVHARMWDAVTDLAAKGRGTDPVIVWDRMRADPGVIDLGGMAYLLTLVDKCPPPTCAPDYAAVIIDQARRRGAIALADSTRAAIATGIDTADVIEDIEARILAIQSTSKRPQVVGASAAVRAMLDALEAPDDESGGVMTGLGPLDDHLGRLHPDELVLIAGRPGAGKSALAACIALNMAQAGLGVIEINSEMSVAQMMRRHVSDACHARHGKDAPTYKDIKRRLLTPGQKGMIEGVSGMISDLPIAMVKKTGLTLSTLRSLVRRQASEWASKGISLGAITVDHVGLLQADGGGRDRYTDQTNIAIGMKALADDLHVPVIALVQLSRKTEDRDNKRPQLSDLRDSGAWEENCDVAIGVYREAYYANKMPEPASALKRGSGADLEWDEWDRKRKSRLIELILMKVREGEEKTIKVWASIGHNAIRGEEYESGGFL